MEYFTRVSHEYKLEQSIHLRTGQLRRLWCSIYVKHCNWKSQSWNIRSL